MALSLTAGTTRSIASHGTIGFGGNGRGRTPPRGANNVRITYLSGGGSTGNRPAGNITQLKAAIPYVDSVTNSNPPRAEPTCNRSMRRGAAAQWCCAISTARLRWFDYEDLAFDASPAIARAKGQQARGSDDAGDVTLIVVPVSDASLPAPSLELLATGAGLRRDPRSTDGRSPGARNPDWLEGSGSRSRSRRFRTRVRWSCARLCATALRRSCTPLTGGPNGEGWEFGRSPHRSDFYAMIEAIPGVDYVRALTVTMPPDAVTEATLVHAGKLDVVLAQVATTDA